MFRHNKTGKVLIGLLLSASIESAIASCLSYYQPPVVDTAFTPLRLHFDVHVDTQWTGLNQSVAVDQRFSQVVTINTLYLPWSDGCNDQYKTQGNLDSMATDLTDDVSDHIGRDFSLDKDYLTYTVRHAGYQTQQGLTRPTYHQLLTIGADDYDPVLDPATGEYFYSDYQRGFSTQDLFQLGYYSLAGDLQAYLDALIGVREFEYFDFSILTRNYVLVDKYGYEGTAVLTSVSAVPLPGGVYLLGSALIALLGLAKVGRRKNSTAAI